MFSSLRSRLWLSYAFLVVTALSVVAVVLLIYVIRNPVAYRQTLERVNVAQKLILRRPAEFVGGTNVDILDRTAQLFDVRVVIFSGDGAILSDTYSGMDVLSLPNENVFKRNVPIIRDSKGRVWVYSSSTLDDGSTLLVAAPRPRVAGLSLFADELLPLFLQGGAIALLLSLLAAFIIARWIADPLQKMLSAARAIPSDAAKPVEPRGPREVQDVMRAFNSMVTRVQASQASQREFVANVSHELKTPLTSVQGFAQAILDGTAELPEARQQAAEVIFNESGRMHRLVLDLLDLARLDAGTADMKMSALDVTALLNAIAEKFAPLAAHADVKIAVQAADLTAMTGDGDRLAQVFTNLVDNALKFTPAGGEVILAARQDGAEAEIEVRDTGQGITPEALPHVFDRFYQADASRSRRERQGAGLGLAIAQEIVAAHGGKISVRSQLGRGTAFTVRLPLAQANAVTIASRKN
jgi:two-component system OmpR family sensor kinase